MAPIGTNCLSPEPDCNDAFVLDGVSVDPANEARLVATAGVGNIELIMESVEEAASASDAVITTCELVVTGV